MNQWIYLKDVMFSQKDLEMSSFNVLVRHNRATKRSLHLLMGP